LRFRHRRDGKIQARKWLFSAILFVTLSITNYTADDVGGAADMGRTRSLVMAVSLCRESIAMNGFLG